MGSNPTVSNSNPPVSSAHPFELSVPDAVARIRAHAPRVCTHISTRLDEALDEAPSREGPLAGVPYGLKDEFDTPFLGTTGGSWRYRDRKTPGVTSAPYRAFDSAGAVLLGKSNLSDLGLAPEASSYVGGCTQNPFVPTRTAGGSSGGSAAAVAYGMHAFDWGTDIGGSIRLPAAFCGVLGLKLSDARWPIQELFPSVPEAMKWLCGQGPLTRTTAQMRAVLAAARSEMCVGEEPAAFQPRTVELFAPEPGRWASFEQDVSPLLQEALEMPVQGCDSIVHPKVVRQVYAGVWASHLDELLAAEGDLSFWEGLIAVLSGTVLRGKLFNDRRFYPLTAELLLMIAIGRYTIFRDRGRALKRAFEVRDSIQDIWADSRLLVMPVTAFEPPRINRSTRNHALLDYTVYGNLSDTTAMSIPFGMFPKTKLPRAIQIMGPPGSEEVLLDLTDRIIAARDRRPDLQQPNTLL
ncbi:MAG TPA: amidase [Polyangiaceae bacterium]|nr:amidase [Polyangiaceae bacterium]